MARIQNKRGEKFPVFVALAAGLLLALLPGLNRAVAGNQDRVESQKAFAEAAEVLFHPRCLNCHAAGDAPLILDDSQPHKFNVKRGPAGKGVGALNCTLCHRDTNQPAGPPGVSDWHMPPEDMPMIFQGRTPAGLCRQLQDPKQNGGRTGEQIINHIDAHPLVLWGWNPGQGRTVPKMSHKEFVTKMRIWVEKGCACPD